MTRFSDSAPTSASSEARALLHDAFARRYRYPNDFPGFSARCRFIAAGADEIGATVAMVGAGDAEAVLERESVSPTAEEWLTQELRQLSRQLWGHDFDVGEGKFAMSLDDTPHPLGPLVLLHDDPHQATFRVRKGRITMATRRQHALLEIMRCDRWHLRPDGRWIPAQFTNEIWDAGTDGPIRTDRYWDLYWPVEGELYPQLRRVETTDLDGATTTSTVTLRSWQLAETESPDSLA
jgi:hypothetical protein